MKIRKGLFALLIGVNAAMMPMHGKAETLQPTKLYLVMSMAGVTAGSMKLSIDPVDGEVTSSLKMKSQGFFKLLTGYKSRAEARSRLAVNGVGPMPVSYDSTYETKKNERKVEIRYSPDDGQITGLETWKRGKPRKSKVPEDLRLDTVDPLTAMLQLRHWIREMRAGDADMLEGSARLFDVFDGRRRYRLDAELLDRVQVEIDDQERPAFRFKVRMEPLAGFSSKDMLANWSSEDGQRWIEVIVTDEDNPIPYAMTTKGGSLATTIRLRKICVAEAGCTKIES